MKVLSVFLAGGIAASPAIFDSSKLANSILKRSRRNNNGLFEEARAADIVRECHEEICSFDEVLEFYENKDDATVFWDAATKKCSEPNACHRPGTATCVNMWRKRRCECRSGYMNTEESTDCSTDIDECMTEGFCANGGACENSVGSFTCSCAAGWGGAQCDEDIDECAADTPVCMNGGECSNTQGSFTCACPANWQGINCEIDVDECANAAASGTELCENSGKCINTQGDFECLCTMGWGGQTCVEDFDECAAALCPAGTVCKSDMTSFTCECPERGCNNLNEAMYQERLQSTHGFEGEVVETVDESSGDAEEEALEEVFEEEVVDEENVEEAFGDEEFNANTESASYDSYDEAATESGVVEATTEQIEIEDNDAGDQYVNIDDNSVELDYATESNEVADEAAVTDNYDSY